MQPDGYGEAKVACERACVEHVGDRLNRVRAGLIGGPGNVSDRLGYWPARFAQATEDPEHRPVLVPLSPAGDVQVVDVRDVAGWMLDAAERGLAGAYDVAGERLSLADVIDAAASAAGYSGERVGIALFWLLEQGVEPWMGPDSLPLTLPLEGYAVFAARSGAAAVAAGLRRRPLVDTLTDSLAFERELGLHRERKAGLSRVTERRLLAQWSSAHTSGL